MMRVAWAAALSVVLHGVAVRVLSRQPPSVVTAVGNRPVELEVTRIAVTPPAPVARPVARRVVSRPVVKDRVPVAEPLGTEPVLPAPVSDPEEGPVEVVAPSSVPAAVGSGVDVAALTAQLQQSAKRCYPAAARRFRQTGETLLRFCLDSAGALTESTVTRSTGAVLLDRAATGCVVPGAAPFGADAFGRCFTLPVRFNP